MSVRADVRLSVYLRASLYVRARVRMSVDERMSVRASEYVGDCLIEC